MKKVTWLATETCLFRLEKAGEEEQETLESTEVAFVATNSEGEKVYMIVLRDDLLALLS